ncbi:HNH endonuclease [Cupriavidus metallidurans]|nr:HNH endonuclease [Cupriavidus sp. SHE]QWC87714.1 HNH endonuclease [Cupriavidus metallidurans]
MPKKAPRPCRRPGCPKHATGASAYCAEHSELKRIEFESRRGSSAARGYGGKWQRERAAYLKANPVCVEHRSVGRVVLATVVDHIVPHKGDQRLFWSRSNWQPLCKACHDAKTAREDGGFGNSRR